MVKYLLDSSVIIESLRLQKIETDAFLSSKYRGEIYISQITIAELFSGRSAQDKEVERYLRYLVSNFKIVTIDTESAILAGQLRCMYQMAMPDALIATGAIGFGLTIVTHNFKDFSKIPRLKVLKPF